MSAIILYFSRAGENYVSGAIRNLSKGNTEVAAEIIHKLTGADLYKIEPAVPYAFNYSECIEQAKDDQKRDVRPALANCPANLSQFDTVYLGFPNYWNTMPMPVFTLLEACDFTGKTILPFCTHEGSGLGRSIQDIKRLCPGAEVGRGLAIQGGRVTDSEKEIQKWIMK